MITILCAGSRGDYQPYIALAQALKKLHKEVRIAGLKDMKEYTENYGINYYSIQADFKSLSVDEKMIKEAKTADNPFKMLLTFNKMKKYGASIASEYYAACEGSELIIYHPGVTIGYFAGEKLGIPSILASPFPLHKTKERLSVILYGRLKPSRLKNIISYHMLQGMLWMASKTQVKNLWKKEFGGLPEKFGKPFENHNIKNNPAVISCSNYVFKRPIDWNENIHQQGYWFVDEQTDYAPSEELENFLDSGDKPIYIGFGSVFDADQKEALLLILSDALSRSGRRGIVSGMGIHDHIPDHVFAIDSIPHSWLFERVAAICHHGGAGTAAAGFKAGIPSIIIPASNDQFAWAHRAYELGVGSKPIPMKTLTADNLAAAIKYALGDNIVKNAKRLGDKIATETGAGDCAEIIVHSMMK